MTRGRIDKSGGFIPNAKVFVQGVLNVTPDSFSDGGRFDTLESALRQAEALEAQGADIIDIGGESTRPFADPVSLDEELKRVIPVIEAIRSRSRIPISIDTSKAEVARAALDAGADIINDVSALRADPRMAEVAAEAGVPVVLMHMKGTPRDMQINPSYEDVIQEIGDFFEERISFCEQAGIERRRLILDPGIGFGKRFQDNLDIINHLARFKERFGLPLLVGPSRKAFLGAITGLENPGDRDAATAGAVAALVMNGADIVRVHNVAMVRDVVKVICALRDRLSKEAQKRPEGPGRQVGYGAGG